MRGNTTISHNDRLGIAVQVGARVVLESGSITHNDDAGVEVDRAGVVRLHDGFIVHVGCTRCVTFSTDQMMKIQARITLTVEFIRTCILIFLFDVSIQLQV